jgi:CARDB
LVLVAPILLGAALCGSTDAVATSAPVTDDLTVAYIQRVTAVGNVATWRASIRNFSALGRSAVRYRWEFDGVTATGGAVSIPAQGSASVEFPIFEGSGRHALRLVIDTDDAVSECEEHNNDLTVLTDATSLGLWVEQRVYDYFLAHQRELAGAHSTSWENWAQGQVRHWNDVLFAGAVYPDTPRGVLERIRIDKIVVVPDGELPPSGDPAPDDTSVDLKWGFPARLIADPGRNYYADTQSVVLTNPFFYDASLIHDVLHLRSLIDNYGFNVHQNPTGSGRDRIPLSENGVPIVGTPFLPMVTSDAVHLTRQTGLMSGEHLFLDAYSALALNQSDGRHENIGAFLNDLPAENEITLLDAGTGSALAGADVRIHRSSGNGQLYGKTFEPTPSQALVADRAGRIWVGQNPFSSAGLSAWHENTVLLLRVAHQKRVRYVFLEASDFNLEYWRGHTDVGTYTVTVEFVRGAEE